MSKLSQALQDIYDDLDEQVVVWLNGEDKDTRYTERECRQKLREIKKEINRVLKQDKKDKQEIKIK